MKKIFRSATLAVALLAFTFVSCSDEDKENPIGENPIVNIPEASEAEVKKELTAIATALGEIQGEGVQLNDFIAGFSSATFDLDTDELTVFAFEDDRAEDPDEFEEATTKAGARATAKSKNIHHHILKGKHNFNFVTADKDYVYKTINGTSLVISKRNNVIYVNGVAMKKNEYFGNKHGKKSHIYCVKDELPEDQISASKVDNVYDIKVVELTGDVKNPYRASKDAFVIVFEKDGYDYRFVDKIRTNDEGLVSVFYDGNKELCYKASNRNYKYIYKGFLVAGMYLSQSEVDNALPHTNMSPIFMPKVGGVKFLDMNGDGVIDFNDKKGAKFIKLDKSEELNTIYLADARQ